VLYLLGASVLITAHHHYYPIDVVPEFWSWVQHMGLQRQIKMPLEIYEEIKDGRKDREKDFAICLDSAGWLPRCHPAG
jgi:Domain of unknown function (DUF4411)